MLAKQAAWNFPTGAGTVLTRLGDFPDRKHGNREAQELVPFALYPLSLGAPHRKTFMPQIVLSHVVASISQLKRNPMSTVAAGRGLSVAILNRNKPAFYCVPAKEYEALMSRLDDLESVVLCKERESDPTIKVSIDDL